MAGPIGRAKVALCESMLLVPVMITVNAAPLTGSGTGLLGEYFNDPNNGSHFVTYVGARLDGTVDFDWASAAPAAGITSDNFSVRWTGRVQPPVSGDYTFTIVADDGVRVWVDGRLLVDNWIDQAATCSSAPVTLAGGALYDLKMEYYEHAGAATARLQWTYPGQTQAAIPQSQLYPPTNGAAAVNAGADRTIALPATCR